MRVTSQNPAALGTPPTPVTTASHPVCNPCATAVIRISPAPLLAAPVIRVPPPIATDCAFIPAKCRVTVPALVAAYVLPTKSTCVESALTISHCPLGLADPLLTTTST